MRRAAILAPALPVAALLAIFILWPIGAVLTQGFRIAGPLPYAELRGMVLTALDRLETADRTRLLARWAVQMDEPQRIEATAAALGFLGHAPRWDRTATFAEQAQAAREAIAALSADTAAQLPAETTIATAALHRRAAIAFRIRDQVDDATFERLRTGEAERWGLDHYATVLGDTRVQRAFLGSLSLALQVATATTLLAFLIAWGIGRGAVPRARTLRWVMLTPLVAPPVVMALALVLLFGRNGLVTHALLDQTLGLINAERFNIYGRLGVALAQVLGFLPAAFVVIDTTLARHDPRTEEAAAAAGATPWQVFATVTVPGAEPGLVRAFLLCFILGMTDFGNPEVIGDNTPTLAGLVYDEAFGFQNMPMAAALSVWLVLPAALLHAAVTFARRRRRFHGDAPASRPPDLALPRAPAIASAIAAVAVCAAILLLYGTVAVGGFVKSWGFDWSPTLVHFMPGGDPDAPSAASRGMASLWLTAQTVGLAAPIGGLLGVAAAFVVDRLRPPGAALISFAALLPAVVPGLILGIGYVLAFNAPFGINALSLSGTRAIVVTNIAFDKLFVGFLAARAALARLDPRIDDAATSLGASALQRFGLVYLPLLRQALILGTLYVFIDGTTTLSAVVFLVGPDTMLAAVRIFLNAQAARYGLACALATALMLLVIAAMAVAAMAERRSAMPRAA